LRAHARHRERDDEGGGGERERERERENGRWRERERDLRERLFDSKPPAATNFPSKKKKSRSTKPSRRTLILGIGRHGQRYSSREQRSPGMLVLASHRT
jgi:hypothetical protein